LILRMDNLLVDRGFLIQTCGDRAAISTGLFREILLGEIR